jgi:streptogramin lyase
MRTRPVLAVLALAAASCAQPATDPNIGTAVLELKQAPATVQCINAYVYYGSTNLVIPVPVTPGVTTSFILTGLPIGPDTIFLRGYNVPCSQTSTASYTWETDSAVYMVTADPPVVVSLKLRPPGLSGRASVGVEFPQPHGTISEVPAPANMTSIALGSDGNFWVAAGNKISRVTPGGVVSDFSLAFINGVWAQARAIVSSPDGYLWFTESRNLNGIGRMDTTGAFRSYLPSTGPTALTVGPDGNVWFLLPTNNRVGRITPDGAISEWTVPTASAGLTGITSASDGNLWFTENTTNKLGRITPTGVITEFQLTAGTGPDSITAGPDGNVWFTEMTASRIGRITPAGAITEFTVPSRDWLVTAITRGTDGQLWFAEQGNGNIGKVTTAGVFSKQLLTSATCYPAAFVGGPDGNMWVAESCSRLAKVIP